MPNAERIRKQVRQMLVDQRRVVRALLRLRAQLGGSLFVRYAECGKEGCACRHGERHGPYYVLSLGPGVADRFAYLDTAQANRARKLVHRNREYQSGLRQLRRINTDLVALLRRYRNEMSNRGRSTIGLRAIRGGRQKSVV
jgi:hypothetical protein